jgi:hypothetical protein
MPDFASTVPDQHSSCPVGAPCLQPTDRLSVALMAYHPVPVVDVHDR